MDDIKRKILGLNTQVPRYTSYPTAPHFRDASDIGNEDPVAAGDYTDGLSLYLHIPFCAKMCWYCGCNTKVTRLYHPVHEYVSYLIKEISEKAKHMQRRVQVRHVHFGGGSPGLLRPDDFKRIMQGLHLAFDIDRDAEIAIEIDPRNMTANKVKAYKECGVNRISLGVQDFDPDVQNAINRVQPYSLVSGVVEQFRSQGINAVNFDLLYGLPHQNLQKTEDTFSRVIDLSPSRIAYFGYAHVPWFKKHMRLIDETSLPDASLRYDLFKLGEGILHDSGYLDVGIDHFAKADDTLIHALKNKILRRNFQGYTTDSTDNLLGFGISSISKINDIYLQNTPDRATYKKALEDGKSLYTKYRKIDLDDKIRAQIIGHIMSYMHVDIESICNAFNVPPSLFDDELHTLEGIKNSGLIDVNGRQITIHPHAKLAARVVASAFDAYLSPVLADQPKHAVAV
jgi:oxygen-independent coproporphyrinogen-3 oxidase